MCESEIMTVRQDHRVGLALSVHYASFSIETTMTYQK